jgi:hypothetical protein
MWAQRLGQLGIALFSLIPGAYLLIAAALGVLTDDAERSDKIVATDSVTLRKLADAVGPLFSEINAALDATYEKSSLSDEEQDLEADLNALAQAAEEARIELEHRGD